PSYCHKASEVTLSSCFDATLPLSTAQREIWFAQQLLGGESQVYHIGEYVEIYGPIDPVSFEAALRQMVEETDSLRVRFVEIGDGPRQVVQSLLDWSMSVIDFSEESDPQTAAHAWMSTDMTRPMDLTRGPLFRYALIKLAPDRFLWYQCCHHIVVDGFSGPLIARRVAEIYTALINGRMYERDVFGSLYQLLDSDSIYRTSDQFMLDRTYWLNRFADRPELVRLVDRQPITSEILVRRTTCLSPFSLDKLQKAA